jgi:hypothetical protein
LPLGGEKLRDKNDKDYLETIRENERRVQNGKSSKKSLNTSGIDDNNASMVDNQDSISDGG